LILLGAYIWYRRKIRELREASGKLLESPDPSRRMSAAGRKESGVGESAGSEGNASATDLLGVEPTFWGVLLSPRRSLRVVNH
jgi:hypothetical protein